MENSGIHIGFDAKRYFNNDTGLGNYSRWLIAELNEHWNAHLHLFHAGEEQDLPEGIHGHFAKKKNKISRAFWRSRGILNDIDKSNIQIYHGLSHELPQGIHKSGIKTVLTVHDLIQKRYPENYSLIDRSIYNRKLAYAQICADAIVCPSEQSKNDLIKYFGTSESKISVIPIGSSILKPNLEDSSSPIAGSYILCVSSFTNRKNLVRLVKAFLQSNLREVKLVISGKSGPIYPRLQRMDLKGKVELIANPSNSELGRLYQHSEFTVYPSLFEGFGIPVLESFAYSKTAVVSNRSSLPEVGGDAVSYFDPKDISSIQLAIENMWHSAKQREHFESKIESQMAKFESKKLMEAYINLYTKLL
ncbi:glycosyltransferase family 4 protein [bacterium]|nr:glycosyltransferase family 4 protein [bacterium]